MDEHLVVVGSAFQLHCYHLCVFQQRQHANLHRNVQYVFSDSPLWHALVLHILEIQDASYVSQCIHVPNELSVSAPSVFTHMFPPHIIFTSSFCNQRGGSESETERENPSRLFSLFVSVREKVGGGFNWSERCITLWLLSYQESLLWCTYTRENVSSGKFKDSDEFSLSGCHQATPPNPPVVCVCVHGLKSCWAAFS